MVTPQNALKLSMWLALSHPQAFKAVLDQVIPITQHRSRMALGSGPAGGTYIPGTRNRMKMSHVRGRFGSFGDDLAEVTVSPIQVDVSDSVSAALADPTLQDINVDIGPATQFDLSSASAASDTSGGFWSSIGSGLSSIGGGLASAVGSVAGAIVNPQTLSAVGNLAATVIKAQGANSQQQALLQQQIQRTATGSGAHPVVYSTNPATGQQVPMYYNASTGQYQPAAPASGIFGSLFSPSVPGSSTSSVSQWMPVILIGGGLLLGAALLIRK
jgi:hypothetical protein